MSKRESSVGLVLALFATFGLSAAALWWAHQYSFGSFGSFESRLSVENEPKVQVNPSPSKIIPPQPKNTPIVTNAVSFISPKSITEPKNKNKQSPIIKLTPVPVKATTKTDLKKFPLREQLKFSLDSPHISEDGQVALKQLANKIKSDAGEGVSIRINAPAGESDFSQSLAQQRGEEIAGYLRDQGLTQKIIISKKGAIKSTKQTRNLPIEISLFKN